MHIAIGIGPNGQIAFVDVDRLDAHIHSPVDITDLAATIGRLEACYAPRWVWADTRRVVPILLAGGVRTSRCSDLRASAALLERASICVGASRALTTAPSWLATSAIESASASLSASASPTLFDLAASDEEAAGAWPTISDVVAEHRRQRFLLEQANDDGALGFLLTLESAGTLAAAEMHAAGLPWSRRAHEAVLERALGPRPATGFKPERMQLLSTRIRAALDAPTLSIDSQAALLRALRTAGIGVESTSKWALLEWQHAAIQPLLEYKQLARLLSANGWVWLDEWVRDGRFRPEYVPGGTATGRWATSGGGALQLPKTVRTAVTADESWKLVVADAAQLEPRVLAAMAGDAAMAAAARGTDFYRALVDSGVLATRDEAKIAILGAMYGATSGEGGRLLPKLARAYPRAMALVNRAAAVGERGGQVTTRLGRTSPRPPETWHDTQSRASAPDASPAEEQRARAASREWGRFTRNFVVQGTAAEWALCWMAELRRRLAEIGAASPAATPASAAGPTFEGVPHLVYFLHDELVVHTPAEVAPAVESAMRDAAAVAGRMLFGDFPIDFPLEVATVQSYGELRR